MARVLLGLTSDGPAGHRGEFDVREYPTDSPGCDRAAEHAERCEWFGDDASPSMFTFWVCQVYLKTWTGTVRPRLYCRCIRDLFFLEVNGVPPSGGGGARGYVTNVIAKNVQLDRVNTPVHLYQTNGGHSYECSILHPIRDPSSYSHFRPGRTCRRSCSSVTCPL